MPANLGKRLGIDVRRNLLVELRGQPLGGFDESPGVSGINGMLRAPALRRGRCEILVKRRLPALDLALEPLQLLSLWLG